MFKYAVACLSLLIVVKSKRNGGYYEMMEEDYENNDMVDFDYKDDEAHIDQIYDDESYAADYQTYEDYDEDYGMSDDDERRRHRDTKDASESYNSESSNERHRHRGGGFMKRIKRGIRKGIKMAKPFLPPQATAGLKAVSQLSKGNFKGAFVNGVAAYNPAAGMAMKMMQSKSVRGAAMGGTVRQYMGRSRGDSGGGGSRGGSRGGGRGSRGSGQSHGPRRFRRFYHRRD